jgi:hypothetical protein
LDFQFYNTQRIDELFAKRRDWWHRYQVALKEHENSKPKKEKKEEGDDDEEPPIVLGPKHCFLEFLFINPRNRIIALAANVRFSQQPKKDELIPTTAKERLDQFADFAY